jgi:hypothetical protein
MGCLCVWSVVHAQSIKVSEYVYKETVYQNPSKLLPTTKIQTRETSVHPIRASTTISEEACRQYLESKNSPLSAYCGGGLLTSSYWSTIIAICTIEEYSCSVNPYGTNNLWGLMSGGHLIYFDSLSAGLDAINNFLNRADHNNRTTIESFRGWYCASECSTWESTVIQTKETVENLHGG